MKTETGVMVIKNGKGWGVVYKDAQSTCYGWVDLENTGIYNPKYCKKPTTVTYEGSSDTKELSTAELVYVKRETKVIVDDNPNIETK